MPRAIQFDEYGDVEVLQVREVPRPGVPAGQVLVRVMAAAINPGEAAIRSGAMAEQFPATFPSGQGSDLAGVVDEVGAGVDRLSGGEAVIGWSEERSAQAEYVVVPATRLISKPTGMSWDVAGSLYVVGVTGYAAVRAVGPADGDVVVVSNAAGGVGSIAVQLARRAGARVIGVAGDRSRGWLTSLGVEHVAYGDGLAERIRAVAPGGVDAFIDTHGDGYVELALALGVSRERVDTIIDFAAVKKYGVRGEGSPDASTAEVLQHMADLVTDGGVRVRIGKSYPLAQVRDAYRDLAAGATQGKIVLQIG